MKFHENPPSGSRVVPCGRTDGHTDKTKLVVAFLNLRKCLIKRRKVYCIGHVLCINCPLKHVLEGKKGVQRRGRRHKQLWTNQGKGKTLEFERRSTISHPLEKIALATGYGSVARQTKQRLRIFAVA